MQRGRRKAPSVTWDIPHFLKCLKYCNTFLSNWLSNSFHHFRVMVFPGDRRDPRQCWVLATQLKCTKYFTHLCDSFHMFSYWFSLLYVTFNHFHLENACLAAKAWRGEERESNLCSSCAEGKQKSWASNAARRHRATPHHAVRTVPRELFSIYNSLICFAGIFDHASLFIPQPLQMSKIALAGTLVGKQHHVAYLRE